MPVAVMHHPGRLALGKAGVAARYSCCGNNEDSIGCSGWDGSGATTAEWSAPNHLSARPRQLGLHDDVERLAADLEREFYFDPAGGDDPGGGDAVTLGAAAAVEAAVAVAVQRMRELREACANRDPVLDGSRDDAGRDAGRGRTPRSRGLPEQRHPSVPHSPASASRVSASARSSLSPCTLPRGGGGSFEEPRSPARQKPADLFYLPRSHAKSLMSAPASPPSARKSPRSPAPPAPPPSVSFSAPLSAGSPPSPLVSPPVVARAEASGHGLSPGRRSFERFRGGGDRDRGSDGDVGGAGCGSGDCVGVGVGGSGGSNAHGTGHGDGDGVPAFLAAWGLAEEASLAVPLALGFKSAALMGVAFEGLTAAEIRSEVGLSGLHALGLCARLRTALDAQAQVGAAPAGR